MAGELTIYPMSIRLNSALDAEARRKHFTDAELAAEWHNACFEFQHTRDYQRNYAFTDEDVDRADGICDTIHRFATHPHYTDAD